MLFAGKLLTRDEAVSMRADLRTGRRKLVFTNGCFDILHLGHVRYLTAARRMGDVLLVGLNSDASVKRNKGPRRPIVCQEDRAALLLALRCVDFVSIFDEATPLELISAVLPDVLVKGRDWAGNVVGSDVVEAAGGCVKLADLVPGHSTTGIIERTLKAYCSI